MQTEFRVYKKLWFTIAAIDDDVITDSELEDLTFKLNRLMIESHEDVIPLRISFNGLKTCPPQLCDFLNNLYLSLMERFEQNPSDYRKGLLTPMDVDGLSDDIIAMFHEHGKKLIITPEALAVQRLECRLALSGTE